MALKRTYLTNTKRGSERVQHKRQAIRIARGVVAAEGGGADVFCCDEGQKDQLIFQCHAKEDGGGTRSGRFPVIVDEL